MCCGGNLLISMLFPQSHAPLCLDISRRACVLRFQNVQGEITFLIFGLGRHTFISNTMTILSEKQTEQFVIKVIGYRYMVFYVGV